MAKKDFFTKKKCLAFAVFCMLLGGGLVGMVLEGDNNPVGSVATDVIRYYICLAASAILAILLALFGYYPRKGNLLFAVVVSAHCISFFISSANSWEQQLDSITNDDTKSNVKQIIAGFSVLAMTSILAILCSLPWAWNKSESKMGARGEAVKVKEKGRTICAIAAFVMAVSIIFAWKNADEPQVNIGTSMTTTMLLFAFCNSLLIRDNTMRTALFALCCYAASLLPVAIISNDGEHSESHWLELMGLVPPLMVHVHYSHKFDKAAAEKMGYRRF